MPSVLSIADYVQAFATSPLAAFGSLRPWDCTSRSADLVRSLLDSLAKQDFFIDREIARHRTATIEEGAVLKGPLILGARCFVAAGAYVRGGNWIDEDCVLGPGSEIKSSFVFARTRLAHFNFVGDSIVGSGVNFEAGSVICNFRNERTDPEVHVRVSGAIERTGVHKFGALVGDDSRLGANSVIAPGALLPRATCVARASLVDQDPTS